ncbi:alpha/beta fold hydrolase [Nocardia sp. 2]|uniref:Alpha/beta fold hydrolase n=1 Tax=Nocardia acididurans TaxID=2802282 RepID=A0ABS1M9A3_9NOCA|nr:alpha/beta hydrolase [Nocardia acididurans]MBL1076866.1 alpha/beta fold hydrolase [Nocardia acididurans]
MRSLVRWVLVPVLLATGCGGTTAQDPGTTWSACAPAGVDAAGRSWECAVVRAPLDYREPDGASIDLAVIRSRTADPAQRLGSLVYNPGGPGGSGFETVAAAAAKFAAALDRYDLVSWDPRGVGRSAPVVCGAVELPERVPRSDAEWAELDAASGQFADSCSAESGRLLPHLGLFDSARDIDLIRAALGEETLNFLGVSYGGQLGAAYATVFPHRVGRMVLDAPGTPLRTFQRSLLDQAEGSEAALRRFLAFCLSGSCPLGATEPEALERVDALLAQADSAPLPTGREPLTRAVAVAALGIGLAAPEIWPQLTTALALALSGDGSELISYADLFTGRAPDGSVSNFAAINTAVNCADYPDVYSADQIRALLPAFAQTSPRFGELTGLRLLECTHWPVHGVGRDRLDGTGAAPILLLGNLGDPQARYDWVREVADALASGVLLTYDGVGHGAYGGVNTCVDAVVNAYLDEGTLPAPETRC